MASASKPKPNPKVDDRKRRTGGDYDAKKDYAAKVSRAISKNARDIAPDFPKVKNKARKNRCGSSLRLFCESYFPHRFHLAWSKFHLAAIEKLQLTITDGGLFSYAMPRGSGKTVLAEVSALWAILYGYRSYVVPVGATQDMGDELVEAIKTEVESNELLAEDFPEACYPVHRLDGINQRAAGQTFGDKLTGMDLTHGTFVFPTLPKSITIDGKKKTIESKCCGSILRGKGLTSTIRGMKKTMKGGRQLRPDLVILDDPQTDESATSPAQSRTRENLINGAILGLAGPKKKIAAIMPCTVIAHEDLADRMLDRDKNPQWRGERSKMLVSFPANMELWDSYAETRRNSLREHGDQRDATEFYRSNREAMDAGSVAAWPERYEPGDLSALQSAMNWYFDRPLSFAADCQNQPLQEGTEFGMRQFERAKMAARLNGLERGIVPAETTRLTAFIDVGWGILWYMVVAWNEVFGGSIVDYGTYPRQNTSHVKPTDPSPSLDDVFPNRTENQRVFEGLSVLLPDLMMKQWQTEHGGESFKVERCLVDIGDGNVSEGIRKAIRRFTLPVYPSRGRARSSSSVGVNKWPLREKERGGYHWKLTVGEGKHGREVQFDSDAWKSFVHSAWMVEMGGGSGLSVFGKKAGSHDMLADHLYAEYSSRQMTKGDTYDKWIPRPGWPHNHLLDCLTGAALAASVSGLNINATGSADKAVQAKVLTQQEVDQQIKNRQTIRPGKPS